MEKQRKIWETPQLIILARGTSDESVLVQCKRIGANEFASLPLAAGQVGCDEPNNQNCGACQARSGS